MVVTMQVFNVDWPIVFLIFGLIGLAVMIYLAIDPVANTLDKAKFRCISRAGACETISNPGCREGGTARHTPDEYPVLFGQETPSPDSYKFGDRISREE